MSIWDSSPGRVTTGQMAWGRDPAKAKDPTREPVKRWGGWETDWYNPWWSDAAEFNATLPAATSTTDSSNRMLLQIANAWLPYLRASDARSLMTQGEIGQHMQNTAYKPGRPSDKVYNNPEGVGVHWDPYGKDEFDDWSTDAAWRRQQLERGKRGEDLFTNAERVSQAIDTALEAAGGTYGQVAAGKGLPDAIEQWLIEIRNAYNNAFGKGAGSYDDLRNYEATMGQFGGAAGAGLINRSGWATDEETKIADELRGNLLAKLLIGSRYTPTYGGWGKNRNSLVGAQASSGDYRYA